MQKIAFVAAIAMVAAAMPATASESLYTRNYDLLISLLPEGSTMEVQFFENGEMVTQIWTAEQFAAYRAAFAASIGRDYTAAAEGAPGGLGDAQEAGDIFQDNWGTTTVNVATPRGNPVLIPIDNKLWIYGGGTARVGIWENDNVCFFGFICSFSYYWTVTQGGANNDGTWSAGSAGTFFNFGSPFGSIVEFDGVEFRTN